MKNNNQEMKQEMNVQELSAEELRGLYTDYFTA